MALQVVLVTVRLVALQTCKTFLLLVLVGEVLLQMVTEGKEMVAFRTLPSLVLPVHLSHVILDKAEVRERLETNCAGGVPGSVLICHFWPDEQCFPKESQCETEVKLNWNSPFYGQLCP